MLAVIPKFTKLICVEARIQSISFHNEETLKFADPSRYPAYWITVIVPA